MRKTLMVLGILFWTTLSPAHPVSFQGAWGLMSYNQETERELTLNYSFRSSFAGAASFYKFNNTVEAYIPRVNFLLKRWNNDDSQGNIYLSVGYGVEKSFNESSGLGLTEVDADWESRKYYFAAQYAQFFRNSSDLVPRDDFRRSKGRIGFAPYLAEYTDLNTWFILQVEKKEDLDPEMTQFVRLFYRNVLLELGAPLNGGWAFNFMSHF